jgi:RNA polymerase sigma factor (sigma-70 family)
MNEAALPPSRGLQSIRWRLLSDDRLVRSATGGEQRAFAAIFERFHQELYRYCRALLGDPEEARDAVQNTMVKVLQALPGEEREIALRPWLYRIAHNEAIALARQRSPSASPSAELPDEIAAAPNQTTERLLEARERLRLLAADLRALPERQRGALVMRELSDMDYGEIATALGTSGGAARQSVYEARVALQEMSEGRDMECESVRQMLSERDGRLLRGRGVRAHLRGCEGCRDFQAGISQRRADLRALAPALPAAAAASLFGEVLGGAQLGGSGTVAGALGGGLGKGLATSAVAKSLAAVAATAVIGVGAADFTGLVHVHAPFGASSSGSSSSPVAQPGSSSAAAAASAHRTAAAHRARAERQGAAAARARGHGARAHARHGGAAHGKALGKGHAKKAHGANGNHGQGHGQQTSASHTATAPGHSGAPPPGQTTQHSSSSGSAVKGGQTSGSGSSSAGGSGGTSKPAPTSHTVYPPKLPKAPKPPRPAGP